MIIEIIKQTIHFHSHHYYYMIITEATKEDHFSFFTVNFRAYYNYNQGREGEGAKELKGNNFFSVAEER